MKPIVTRLPNWLLPKAQRIGLYETEKLKLYSSLSKSSGTIWYFLEEDDVVSQSNDPADFLEVINDQSELLKFTAWLMEKGRL